MREQIIKLPAPIGTKIWDKDFPERPFRIIGYRIGRIIGEDEEEYEEKLEGVENGNETLYVEYSGFGIESSVPIDQFGTDIFLTKEEMEQALN